MKDLTALLTHQATQNAKALRLASDKSIVMLTAEGEKELGTPISSALIGAMLKASLPSEIFSQFSWGKEISHELEIEAKKYQVNIMLGSDKTFLVEIAKKVEATKIEEEKKDERQTEAYSTGRVIREIKDDPIDDVVFALTTGENLGLIYYSEESLEAGLEAAVQDLGHEIRASNHDASVLEVLNYFEYPLLIMQLGEDFRSDPVYDALCQMTMDRRRKQYSILVAPGLTTGDTMLAFSLSVHLVINTDDLGKITEVARKEIPNWQRFIGTLVECLAKAGKA